MRARRDPKQEDNDFIPVNCFLKGQLHQHENCSDAQGMVQAWSWVVLLQSGEQLALQPFG